MLTPLEKKCYKELAGNKDVSCPLPCCNTIEKEILKEFKRLFYAPEDGGIFSKIMDEKITAFLSSALARQRDSFLTMLPPEKKEIIIGGAHINDWQTMVLQARHKGWNDYRRAALEALTPKK